MFSYSRWLQLALIISLPSVLLFQNCAKEGSFRTPDALNFAATNGGIDVDVLDDDDTKKMKKYKEKSEVTPLMANRVLMTNIFLSIFGNTLKSYFVYYNGWQEGDFGSGFSAYNKRVMASKDCAKKRSVEYLCINKAPEIDIASNMGLNTRREAWRMHACQMAARNNASLLHALRKIDKKSTLAKPPALSYANVKDGFKLFFRNKPNPPVEVLDSLRIVAEEEEKPSDQWRALLLTVCLSPHWQVL